MKLDHQIINHLIVLLKVETTGILVFLEGEVMKTQVRLLQDLMTKTKVEVF